MAEQEPTLALRPRHPRPARSSPKPTPPQKRPKRAPPSTLNIREILKKLLSSPIASVFKDPPDDQEFPDYHQKVDHIDLYQVQTNLRDGLYRDNEVRFISDVRRIWVNALDYFPPTSSRYQLAQTLQKDFEYYVNELDKQRDPFKKMEERIVALERQMTEINARLCKNAQKREKPPSNAELKRLSGLISKLPEQYRKGLVDISPRCFNPTSSGAYELDLEALTREEYTQVLAFIHSKTRKPKSKPALPPAEPPSAAVQEDYSRTIRRGQAELMQAKGAESDSDSEDSSSEGDYPSLQ